MRMPEHDQLLTIWLDIGFMDKHEEAMVKKLDLMFEDKKQLRRLNWLVKQFSSSKAFIYPKSLGEHKSLLQQRGFDRQFRKGDKTFFPTDQAWDHFVDFIDILHRAPLFREKVTYSDVFKAYASAFAALLHEGLAPENSDEFSDRLPPDFLKSVFDKAEIQFHYLDGVNIENGFFIQIGNVWLGRFNDVYFDDVDNSSGNTQLILSAIRKAFSGEANVISGGLIAGSSKRAEIENSYRYEVGLGILAIMINLSYLSVFKKLKRVCRIEKAEIRTLQQLTFGFSQHIGESNRYIKCKGQLGGENFEITHSKLTEWYEYYSLAEFNLIASMEAKSRTELQNKLLNAVVYFRQATLQPLAEMQLSMLWVAVESLLTTSSDKVLESNLPSLLAITIWRLPKTHWPNKAASIDDLERVFKKYYTNRSKTLHHGSLGHVTSLDVQEFSTVVSNLIVSISYLAANGHQTKKSQLLDASKRYLNELKH